MNNKNVQPPRWAQRFLQWYCRPEVLEDLQGDLNEYFDRHLKRKGPFRAKIIFIIDVFKFCRSYTIRKPDLINYLIHWIMLGSYIKSSGRSIVRNKLFSAINIVGLAISMSVGLLIISMMSDLTSYDKFHSNYDRIYRVVSQYEYLGNKDDDRYATTSLRAARLIKESVTGIENIAVFNRDFSGDLTVGAKKIPLNGLWANEGVLTVFSFGLLQGNPESALKDPFSIVLTEQSARKVFGDQNALGKTVTLQDREYTVTGIMKDVPIFSHIKFDMLGSLSTRDITEKENKNELRWSNMWGTWVYVLLPGSTNIKDLERKFDVLSEREDKTVANTHITLRLQPINDIMTGENLSNQISTVMGKTTIWILGGLALITILSACLNYTNLSIARSFRRSKEVGIRKTIGASKGHVVNQFIIESVMISLASLLIAFGLFLFIRPHFIGLESSLQELLTLKLSARLILAFIAFAIVVGAFAGFFPAMFFGRLNAVQVLKNLASTSGVKGVTMRKVLIVFQYCISIIAITVTIVLYKQYKHFISYDLGFTTENILNIRMHGNKADLLKKGLSELPEVQDMSQSMLVTSIGNYWGTTMKNPNNPLDSTGVHYNVVDERYLPLHDHRLIAGKNFVARAGKLTETEVIVNEHVLSRFNLAKGDPSKAIDEIIRVDGKDLRIIGVLKNFEYGRANNESKKEVVMRYSNEAHEYLNVKVLSKDWPATYAKIESIWKQIDPVHPLDAKFYNEQIEQAFRGLKASVKVGGFLAFLVICIASIGLFGMVVFATETRLKEISIRKVLGSSETRLLLLLSKSFFVLVAVATLIALPVTYIFFEKILLPEIANHAPLDAFQFMLGTLVIIVLAVGMICSQTLKVARTNPAEVLKNE